MLYYHKCRDCLTAFSSEERSIDECDCGGSVFYMGQVHGDEYVKAEDRPACDGRCTHACGPSCDCKCGGANHGTGKVVQVVIDKGKVKAVGLSEDDIKRADIFRKLRDYAYALYEKKWNGSTNSHPQDYMKKIRDGSKLDRTVKSKVYSKRHEQLIEFIKNYS